MKSGEALQRDVDRLESWAVISCMEFNESRFR